MRNPWILATASSVAMAGTAQAASPPPVFNWTGFYIGLNGGAAGHEATTRDLNGWGNNSVPPYVSGWFNSNRTTATIGGQVGYSWQFDRFVVGAEADVNYIGSSTTFVPPNNVALACGATCGVSAANQLTWLATFRGRAGFTIDRILVYGTAGLAVGEINNHWGWGGAGFSDSQFSVSGTKIGYVVGGGIEAMVMPHVMLRVEALHVDLGTSNNTVTGAPFCCTAPGTFTTEFKNTANIGRVGLSYRW